MNIIDEPENQLERLLRLAAKEPAHRPEFYRVLLDSPVFVLGSTDDEEMGEKYLEEGSALSLVNWQKEDGTSVIPFFSSFDTLQTSIEEDVGYLELPARVLFEMTQGANLIMNPHSEFGKEFLPDEVALLLDDQLGTHSEVRTIEKETEVMMGQPEIYPVQLVDSLTTLFSKHEIVKAAYLGLIHDASQDEQPNLIIGLQGDGDLEAVIHEAGTVAWDTTDEDEVVDFIVLDNENDGIAEYFLNETKPFYEHSWGSKLTTFTEPGQA